MNHVLYYALDVEGDGQPMNSTQVDSMLRQGLTKPACLKAYAKAEVGSEVIAQKMCSFSAEGVDSCAEGPVGNKTGSVCLCHSDKCNGVGQLLPSVMVVLVVLGCLGYFY